MDQVPLEVVIGAAAGGGLGLFIIGFLSYCLIMNIYDWWSYNN